MTAAEYNTIRSVRRADFRGTVGNGTGCGLRDWRAAKMKPKGGYLCIGCLERRLHRQAGARRFQRPPTISRI